METEKKMLKPNSHKRLRRAEFSYWSDLPLDLLIKVFNLLGFADFQRAKSVCSSWHLASKQSLPNNQIPWLILFPEEDNNNNNNSCILFNLEESKFYKTQDLGVEFTNSVCLATCGCWFFMQDPRSNLFILNLLTNERINLPQVESLIGTVKIRRVKDVLFTIRFPVLWIDENTKDYAVWVFYIGCVFYFKKGDKFWNQIPGISYCNHMVYKDHKLYIFSDSCILSILDFSGEVPQLIYEGTMGVYPDFVQEHQFFETRLVVTLTGDVLRVNRVLNYMRPLTWSFYVYKIYSSSSGVLIKKPEKVVSLGDEAIVFDLGITVFGNDDLGGFRRNSIYFVPEYVVNKKIVRANMYDAFLFDIQTEKKEKLYISTQLPNARWFLPNFKQT